MISTNILASRISQTSASRVPSTCERLIQSAAHDWRDYQRNLAAYEAEREKALSVSRGTLTRPGTART